MDKCILCADTARERKYFFKEQPLCTMHYSEYLEVLIEEKKSKVTSDEASSAFSKYKLMLEPTPLSEKGRVEKVKKEQEKRREEEAKKEQEKKKVARPLPRPYRMRR